MSGTYKEKIKNELPSSPKGETKQINKKNEYTIDANHKNNPYLTQVKENQNTEDYRGFNYVKETTQGQNFLRSFEKDSQIILRKFFSDSNKTHFDYKATDGTWKRVIEMKEKEFKAIGIKKLEFRYNIELAQSEKGKIIQADAYSHEAFIHIEPQVIELRKWLAIYKGASASNDAYKSLNKISKSADFIYHGQTSWYGQKDHALWIAGKRKNHDKCIKSILNKLDTEKDYNSQKELKNSYNLQIDEYVEKGKEFNNKNYQAQQVDIYRGVNALPQMIQELK